ncbi:MAG: alkylation response protein AidB-like acyl-CoA dehydrogenase [Maribacter sp.]|jgi:alkylation response protein AidB-like acyl-CoA dehydrogenase
MDFSWPEEYVDYKKKVIQFAKDELNGSTEERDEAQEFPHDLWKKCAGFGIHGLAVPKAYGGTLEEVNFMRAMLAMEGFGIGCDDNGLAFALNAQMWTVQTPILHFGNEAQKQKYLPKMVKGEIIGSHALTEPDAGSDIFSMQMTAKKVEDGYILNGKKHLITLAPICDFTLVLAKTNPKLGKWGVSAFLVDKGSAGFTSSPKMNKMGMRSIPIGELEFKDCQISHDALLGSEGLGFSILNHSLEYDRCCILASQLGAMERQMEYAIAYAKKRIQSKQTISKFQSVSNRIVDMKLRLETSRLLLYKTAWLKQNGNLAMMEAAMLKLHLSESFVTSSLDVMRTYGGRSYLSEYGVERDMRDSIGGILYAGTSDIQRNIIASLLGL